MVGIDKTKEYFKGNLNKCNNGGLKYSNEITNNKRKV